MARYIFCAAKGCTVQVGSVDPSKDSEFFPYCSNACSITVDHSQPRMFEAVIAVADQVDKNGDVYPRAALELMASQTEGLRMDGDNLIAHMGEHSVIEGPIDRPITIEDLDAFTDKYAADRVREAMADGLATIRN